MARWLKTTVDTQGRRTLRFIPQMSTLEARDVPAIFYVDPTLAGASGDTVTFNAGNVNSVPSLILSNDFAYWNANQATANAFPDLATALKVAEANPGPDTIILASGAIPLNNTDLVTLPDGDANVVPITQELTIRGQGAGASVILAQNNTKIDINDGNGLLDDPFTAIFRVAGANAKLIAEDFRLDGNGKLIGAGFQIRDGASADFDGVSISNIIYTPNGQSEGVAILGIGAKAINISNSDINNYGRIGTLLIESTAVISNNVYTGRGAGDYINNAIELNDGAVAIISGNVITSNAGVNAGFQSSGIIVAQGDAGTGPGSGKASESWIIGNTISNNALGITVGSGVADDSILLSRYNNIVGNQIGVDGKFANVPVQADKSWWGDVSGPFAGPGTGTGDPVRGNVVFAPTGSGSASTVAAARQHVMPVVAVTDLSSFVAASKSYIAAITTINSNVNPVGASFLNNNPGTFKFDITFAQPVEGLTLDGITITSTMGGTPVSNLTGSGAAYQLTISGLTGEGTISASVNMRAADNVTTGFLTAASNVSTITVDIPNVAPTLSVIADQSTTPGATVGPLALTVADDADPALVTLSAASSNPALVASGSVVLAGSGGSRTVSFTTTAGAFGNAVITITGTDADGASTTRTFLVEVPNTPATLTMVADQTTTAGANVGPLAFTVADDGGAANVTLTASSSNPALVAPGSITFGGAAENRTISFATSPNTFGTAVITITATDSEGAVTTRSFAVNVPQPANTAPTITGITDRTVVGGTAIAPISFMVGDAETPAANLTVVASSSNPALVPANGLLISGTGANRTVTITPVTGATGTAVITLTVTDAAGLATSTSFALTVEAPLVPPARVPLFAVGSDAGGLPEVAVYGANGKARFTFLAYESAFTGGVNVATADVDGDNVDDIITGAGVGGGARIRVFSGVDGSEIANFFAFDTAFRGGATVAAADLDGDGRAEIVTGAGFGGGPHVRAFKIVNGQPQQILNFFAFDTAFRGGVNVAAGLVGSNTEIVVGAGTSGGPHVRRYNITQTAGSFTATDAGSFFAGPSSFTGGVFVTVGRFGGAVGNSIATSLGATSAPVVTFRSNGSTINAYESSMTAGVRLGAGDVNGDGTDELLVAPGIGGGARIQALTATGTQVLNFFAFNNAERDGYFVG